METPKKQIKVNLTNLEKENLENHASKLKTAEAKIISDLILSLNPNSLNLKNLEDGEIQTAFNIDLDLDKILTSNAKVFKLSKNRLLRLLIANLPTVEHSKKEDLNKEISTRINLKAKEEIQLLCLNNKTTTGTMVRQIFSNVELISIRKRDYDLDSKIWIKVSKNFKSEFTKYSKSIGISNSELFRNIIYSILGE